MFVLLDNIFNILPRSDPVIDETPEITDFNKLIFTEENVGDCYWTEVSLNISKKQYTELIGESCIKKGNTYRYEKIGENQLKDIRRKIGQKVLVEVYYSARISRWDIKSAYSNVTSRFTTKSDLIGLDAFVDLNDYLIRYIKLIIIINEYERHEAPYGEEK